ncbi:ATP-binding protein [Kineococcus sp. SYSU DK001]|uniref:ATP-binding protein n=1 Tax=Kineococcus sp. SYSU DK001 TaxID=3383122 RepID=UPI003D7D680D
MSGTPRADARADAGGTSVAAGLTRALGLVVALLLLVGVSGAGGLLVTGASRARETQLRGLEAANATVHLTLLTAEAAVRDHRDTGRPQPLDTYRRALDALPAQRAHVEQLLTDPLQRSLFAEQDRSIDTWLAVLDPDRGAADTAGAAAEATAFTAVGEAGTRLDVLVRHQRDDATTAETWARYGALTVTVLTLAAALAVGVGTGARTRRALVDPLRSLVDVLDALGRGQRGAHADPTEGPTEVRTVALAVNDLARENARLLEAAERSARLHRLAGDIGRQVRDQLVAQEAIDVAVTRLGEALDVTGVRVQLLDAVPGERGTAPGPGAALDDHRDWLADLHRTGAVHAVTDLATDLAADPVTDLAALDPGGRPPALERSLRAAGARAVLLVPIGAGESPHGLLTVLDDRGPRRWSEPEVELARSVAVDLARALVLAGLYRAQERLLAELREVETVKSDLLATVSHELRTPLTSISGYLELLRDGAVGEVGDDVAAVLGIVERNTDRLRALIEDLLLLSRVESGPARGPGGTSTVADLVTSVLATLPTLASRAGARGAVRCTTPRDALAGLRVSGDPEHLHRALLAVVENAVKFSPAGSLVRLRVEHDRQDVRIIVQDNGMGIPAGETATVFDRFARGSNAALLQVPGTGLGLTIARDLLRLHGGGVALESELDRGTTAVITLPHAPPHAVAPDEAPDEAPDDGLPDRAAPAPTPSGAGPPGP